jgi:hypothetical protein
MRTIPHFDGQLFASPVNPDLLYLFTGIDRAGAIAAARAGWPLKVYAFLVFDRGTVTPARFDAAEWAARNAVPVPDGLTPAQQLLLARTAHTALTPA